MSGNLSHQIEHHLFPDLPSNRYHEIAPRVREVFHRYELKYHAAPMVKQLGSAWHKVLRLSLPNDWLHETRLSNAPAPGGQAVPQRGVARPASPSCVAPRWSPPRRSDGGPAGSHLLRVRRHPARGHTMGRCAT